MRLIHPNSDQARTITQTMHSVASAEDSIVLQSIEQESIVAIQRHLLCLPEPMSAPGHGLPADLAAILPDPVMRLTVLRILIMLPFLDGKVLPAKVRVVQRAAALLGVEESTGLLMLRQAMHRQYRRITLGILSRAIRQFWSHDGKARVRDWADMAQVVLPVLSGSKRGRRERYQALAQKAPGTLGRTLHNYYRENGFPMPGEPKSFPEKFVIHEFYHILGGYPLTHQGEMLAAAFTGGNVEKLCMDMILLALLQYQVGATVAGVSRGVPGLLNPEEFFHAIARGATMTVDLMDDWDFWAVADRPLEELRALYRLPPLTGGESFAPLALLQAT